jgi:hypothetical protein
MKKLVLYPSLYHATVHYSIKQISSSLEIFFIFFYFCKLLFRRIFDFPISSYARALKQSRTASCSSSDKTARDKGVPKSPTSLLTQTSKQTIKLQLPRRHYENSAFLTCKLRLSLSMSIKTKRANLLSTTALCRRFAELLHLPKES